MPRSGLRIIGGEWRGRRISVPRATAARPTTDRVRETLFNWLAPVIEGARCLDLFAGSGALGLEALSRGAAWVDFVDRDRHATNALRETLHELDAAPRAALYCLPAQRFLQLQSDQITDRWDVVFIDAPFRQGLVDGVLKCLPPLLSADHRVYLETERELAVPAGESWTELRKGQAGQLTYRLIRYRDNP